MSELEKHLRAEFEAQPVIAEYGTRRNSETGRYISVVVETCWQVWQAARRAPAAAPAPVAAIKSTEERLAECKNFMWDFEQIRVRDEEIADLRAALAAVPAAAPIVQPVGAELWACFHCGESFTDRASAALHFGKTERQSPACSIDIVRYREMEETARRHADDDTDLDREIYRLRNEQQVIAQRAEEKGYARGLKDAAPTTTAADAKDAARVHGHRDPYYLLANCRRMLARSVSACKPNWVLAMELFATGSTSAHEICREAGIDPDSVKVERAAIATSADEVKS